MLSRHLHQGMSLVAAATLALASLPATMPTRLAEAAPAPPPGTWITERFDYGRTSRVNNASASISAPSIKWAYPVGGGPSVWMHDVTGANGLPDGVPELITYGAGRVRAYDVSGSPPTLLWQTEQLPSGMRLGFVGDLDGNGSVELIVQAWLPMRILAVRGRDGAVLSRIDPLQPYPTNAGYLEVQVGDANNDGRLEVFFYDEAFPGGGPTIYTYAGGAASPQLYARFTALAGGGCCRFPQALLADLNGDTVPEVTYHMNDSVHIVRTTGPLAWTIVSSFNIPGASTDEYAGLWIADVAPNAGLEIVHGGRWGRLRAINVAPSTLAMSVVYAHSFSLSFADWRLPVAVGDLDGVTGLEIVLAPSGDTDPVQIRAGSTGALLATAPAGRKYVDYNLAAYTLAQLDADAPLEMVLQDSTNVYVYQGVLSLSHTLTDAAAAPWRGPAYLIDPRFGSLHRNFTLDLNGDSINELLVYHRNPARLAAYDVSGSAPILRGQYVFPAGVNMSLEYFGNTPFGRGLVLSGSDGNVYLLDATFNLRRQLYAGTGLVGPFVVDTNGDGQREVLFRSARGEWVNLNPLTATFSTPPAVNYVTNWGPLALRPLSAFPQAAVVPLISTPPTWAFPMINISQAPTYTLQLRTKNPIGGAEAVIVSRVFTEGYGYPVALGLGQLVGGAGSSWDMFVSLGQSYSGPPGQMHALNGATLQTLWTAYRLAGSLAAAVADTNGDGIDDLIAVPVFQPQVRHGSTGVNLISSAPLAGYGAYAMVDNLDPDADLEAVFYGGSSGNVQAHDLGAGPPALKWLITDTLGTLRATAAIAAVTPGNGRDIVYAFGNGTVAAYEGINGTLIYSRALGIGFDTATCAPNINTPASYPGWQREIYESICPGAGRFATLEPPVVANIDGEPNDEILVSSGNGYLYALNAENGSLRWAYNFFYPMGSVTVANVDGDSDLEILVSVADGYLYALDQAGLARPQSAWDGAGALEVQDIDVQVDTQCFEATWRVTADPSNGLPQGFRVAIRDETGTLVSNGYLDVPYTIGAVAAMKACYNDADPNRRLVTNLLRGKRYFAEVINYQGILTSAPSFSDGVLIAEVADFSGSAKFAQPATVTPGGSVTWTVTVRNSGVYSGQAQLSDPIPLNTTYEAGSLSASFGFAAYNSALNRIEWQETLEPGQVATITFRTTVNAAFGTGLIRNEAQITDLTNGLVKQIEATVAVNAPNLSSAVKLVSAIQAFQTDVLTYTIRLTNTGSTTATGVLVDDPLPGGVNYVAGSLSASGGSGSATYNSILKRVRWTGVLGPGQTLEVAFRAQVAMVNGVINNCAAINDGVGPVFQRCALTVVGFGGPLIQTLKTSDRLTYNPGDPITYTIVVSNVGTQPASVVLNDPLPAGVTVNAVAQFPPGGALNFSTSNVSWQGVLNANGYVVLTIRAQIAGSLTDGVLVNRAFITNTTTNVGQQAVREVVVGNAPFINGDKQGNPLGARPGDTVTYTIRLFNTGTTIATNAVLTDPLPFGMAHGNYVTASVGAVTYNPTLQQLQWSGPVFITQPTVVTWRVTVLESAPLAGTVVNQAFSYDNVSDYDQFVATTAVNIPAGKALIRGYVYSGTLDTPLPGVLLSASGLSGTVSGFSNAGGFFSILVDAGTQPQNYALFMSVPAGLVSLSPNPVGLAAVVEGDVRDAIFRVAAPAPPGFGWIKGVVFNDANGDGQRNIFSEPGIPGVNVQTSSGQSAQTAGDGSYYFLVPAGSRTITQTNLAGWVSTTPDVVVLTVASQGAYEVNFGDRICEAGAQSCTPPPAGMTWLVGYVYEDTDQALNVPDGLIGGTDLPLGGVLITVDDGPNTYTATTNVNGFYEVLVNAASLASVEAALPSGYLSLTPNPVGINLPAGQMRRMDFGLVNTANLPCDSGTHGIVNGFVYSDTLVNGQFIIGVDQPTLTPAVVSVFTKTQNTNWMYAFTCVAAASVSVSSTNPAGYTNTTPNSVNATVNNAQATRVDFGKAFQSIPLGLRYAYVPIVQRP
ncbi:MAG: hypothetical protein RMN25_10820 [Anaerolineae bacterium]|nr:hypothetical protein [Thermoflexales bacterium]MDW8408259.1 hypothetical protein [Anaerolineae bacterium]